VDAVDTATVGVVDFVIGPGLSERVGGAFEPEENAGGVLGANVVEVAVAIDVGQRHRGGAEAGIERGRLRKLGEAPAAVVEEHVRAATD